MVMYLVYYTVGDAYDTETRDIFVTENEQTAIDYCDKFIRIGQACLKYYRELDDEKITLDQSERLNRLEYIRSCFYKKIERR